MVKIMGKLQQTECQVVIQFHRIINFIFAWEKKVKKKKNRIKIHVGICLEEE